MRGISNAKAFRIAQHSGRWLKERALIVRREQCPVIPGKCSACCMTLTPGWLGRWGGKSENNEQPLYDKIIGNKAI